jgi:hypothetical protein
MNTPEGPSGLLLSCYIGILGAFPTTKFPSASAGEEIAKKITKKQRHFAPRLPLLISSSFAPLLAGFSGGMTFW